MADGSGAPGSKRSREQALGEEAEDGASPAAASETAEAGAAAAAASAAAGSSAGEAAAEEAPKKKRGRKPKAAGGGGNKKYPCPAEGCGKSYTSQGGLDYHTKREHGERDASGAAQRVPCPNCSKTFTSQQGLAYHTRQRVCHRKEDREREKELLAQQQQAEAASAQNEAVSGQKRVRKAAQKAAQKTKALSPDGGGDGDGGDDGEGSDFEASNHESSDDDDDDAGGGDDGDDEDADGGSTKKGPARKRKRARAASSKPHGRPQRKPLPANMYSAIHHDPPPQPQSSQPAHRPLMPTAEAWVACNSDSALTTYAPQEREPIQCAHGDQVLSVEYLCGAILPGNEEQGLRDLQVLHAGGSIWNLEWIPDVPGPVRYACLSTTKHFQDTRLIGQPCFENDMLQIWSFQEGRPPQFVLGVLLDAGDVLSFAWCPSGGYFKCLASATERLGVVAVACGDSTVRVLSVPFPQQRKAGEPAMFLRAAECLTMSGSSDQPQCVSWSTDAEHSFLAVGFSNGTVSIFDVAACSPNVINIPRRHLVAFSEGHVVRDVCWSPWDDHLLAVVGHNQQLRCFHVTPEEDHVAFEVFTPPNPFTHWKVELRWLRSRPAILVAGEEPYTRLFPLLADGLTMLCLVGHNAPVLSIDGSNFVNIAVSGACDGTVRGIVLPDGKHENPMVPLAQAEPRGDFLLGGLTVTKKPGRSAWGGHRVEYFVTDQVQNDAPPTGDGEFLADINMQSVQKVRLCPYQESASWVLFGSRCGLAFLDNVETLASEALKVVLSSPQDYDGGEEES